MVRHTLQGYFSFQVFCIQFLSKSWFFISGMQDGMSWSFMRTPKSVFLRKSILQDAIGHNGYHFLNPFQILWEKLVCL